MKKSKKRVDLTECFLDQVDYMHAEGGQDLQGHHKSEKEHDEDDKSGSEVKDGEVSASEDHLKAGLNVYQTLRGEKNLYVFKKDIKTLTEAPWHFKPEEFSA